MGCWVHYVGQMQPGSMARRMMDLVTRKGVQWHFMGAVYDRMVFLMTHSIFRR